jgi:hypothetical protein
MTAARLGVSQNDSPTRACLSLLDCSKRGHCPNSHQHGHSETHGEVTPQAGHLAPPELVTHPASAADNPNRHGSDHTRRRAGAARAPAEREAGKVDVADDATELWAAVQMVLILEGVEYRLK